MNSIVDLETGLRTPQQILQSVLTGLNKSDFSEIVDYFDDQFTFTDHALALEFTDKGRLIEFFQKARELFPDTVVETEAIYKCGNHAIAEWKLTATQTTPYGSIQLRSAISLSGTSVIHVKNGKIVRWSDYYDLRTSRRMNLASFFTEWVEY